MDKLERYRQIIQEIIKQHAQYQSTDSEIETIPIWDTENDQYLLAHVGRNRSGRVHGFPIHVQIKNNKFWIEWDGTEYGVANELINKGVPKEDIVLAFYHPKTRALTDFAMA
jgi:hypothetical protein